MSFDADSCEKILHEAVTKAGETIKEAILKRDKDVTHKSCDIDLVTKYDQKVEHDLISTILANFPDHKIIGEESTAGGARVELTDDPTWIIDPIDGTMNFVHGCPHSAVSVGVLVNKLPVLGVVYNPMLGQRFEARRGRGATLNGRPINVSKVTELSDALIGYEFGTSRDEEKSKAVQGNICNLLPKVHGIRSLGSAALNMAYVACGSFDSYFEMGIHAWDVAAGWLLVTEAGGTICDPSGGEFDVLSRRVLVAGTKQLAQTLASQLVDYNPGRD